MLHFETSLLSLGVGGMFTYAYFSFLVCPHRFCATLTKAQLLQNR